MKISKRIKKAIYHPILALKHVQFLWEFRIVAQIRKGQAWLFDRLNGLNTRTVVGHEKLAPFYDLYLDHATWYVACPLPTLRMTIEYAVKVYQDASYFVDIGCGEGRACFFAARYFDRVTGIDFSAALIEAAKANLRNFTGDKHKIEFLVQDAATFRLPETKCAVFLFNPFDEVVMAKFLQLNYRHFSRYHSIVIYVSDVCSELLLRAGFLRSHRFLRGPKVASIYTVGSQIVAIDSAH